jgi:hypothetical protein
MTPSINPFIVSGHIPAAFFCDRQEESERLKRLLCNQQNVVLSAARRMGKTSLVDHVFAMPEIADNYITISIDILDTNNFSDFVFTLGNAVFEKVAKLSDKLMKLFPTVMKSLQASFGYDTVLGCPTFDIKLGDVVRPEYTLQEIFQFLSKADKRCLVVIDEFQQITYYPEANIEATLRKHIQTTENVNFVFAGSHRRIMSEMFGSEQRPFYNSARSIDLEPIDLGVYTNFAQEKFRENGKDIDAEAIRVVYETFGGVTLYNQQLMNDAYDATPVGECCDVKTVKLLIDNFIQESGKKQKEILQFVTEQQKAVLYAILADEPVKSITSSAFTKRHRLKSPSATQSAMKALLRSDLVTRREGLYSISDPLMDLWLKKTLFIKH